MDNRNEDAPAQIPGIKAAADEMKIDGPRKSRRTRRMPRFIHEHYELNWLNCILHVLFVNFGSYIIL